MSDGLVYLTFDQVLAGAGHVIGPDAVLRDPGLLQSAVYRPSTVAFDTEAYPTIHLKAAALMHSLVMNHAFLDGNKRIGWAAAEAFYRLNDWRFDGTDDQAFALTVDIAKGALDVLQIADHLTALFAERTRRKTGPLAIGES